MPIEGSARGAEAVFAEDLRNWLNTYKKNCPGSREDCYELIGRKMMEPDRRSELSEEYATASGMYEKETLYGEFTKSPLYF